MFIAQRCYNLYKISLQYRWVYFWKEKENEMYKIDNTKVDD